MVCGAWLAWPWFVFNAIAMGSPTRKKEIVLSMVAVAGTVVLAAITVALMKSGVIETRTELRLALLAIATWKLTMATVVQTVQARTFGVYTYYGGRVRTAAPVIAAGYWIRGILLSGLDDPFWIIIIAGGV
jgi:hypothetical protein